MSPKLTLDTAAMQDDFFADSFLLGIGSALPGYRFCQALNLAFDISLAREIDMDIEVVGKNKNENVFFPVYRYVAPIYGHTHLLYKIKNQTEVLFPEIRQLDYLWLIREVNANLDPAIYVEYVKKIPSVQLVVPLIYTQLKHPELLLL
jgi:hypothetical protein